VNIDNRKGTITKVGTVVEEDGRRMFAGWEFKGGDEGLVYDLVAGGLKTVAGYTPDELVTIYERALASLTTETGRR
jgi:hypothetical protein